MNTDPTNGNSETQDIFSNFGWKMEPLSIADMIDLEKIYAGSEDQVLVDAWRLILALDKESNRQKLSWLRIRQLALHLSLLMLVLATFATWIAPILLINPDTLVIFGREFTISSIQMIEPSLQLTLIIMPLLITGLMAYTSEFQSTPVWIVYRQKVEDLYRETILYRQQAGAYQIHDNNSLRTNRLRLIAHLEVTYQSINEYQEGAPFIQSRRGGDEIWDEVIDRFDYRNDTGFDRMQADEYVENRIMPQLKWYDNILVRNLASQRRWRIIILALTGLSTVAVAIGIQWSWLVIMVNAIISYVNALNVLNSKSQNNSNYLITAQNLDLLATSWQTVSQNDRGSEHNINILITRTEEILSQERNTWFQQAMKTSLARDNVLNKAISNLTGNQVTSDSVSEFNEASHKVDLNEEDVKKLANNILEATGDKDEEAVENDEDEGIIDPIQNGEDETIGSVDEVAAELDPRV